MQIIFEVHSSHNPIPYKRTTQKQKWTDREYKKYQIYKSLIIAEFVKETGKFPYQILSKNTKYHVGVLATYKDKRHGDTDNVAKGVNDAIFSKPLSDKFVAGSYDYQYGDEAKLQITISDEAYSAQDWR